MITKLSNGKNIKKISQKNVMITKLSYNNISLPHKLSRVMELDIRWDHPGSTFIAGATNSGKTHILNSILQDKNNLFKSSDGKEITNVILCYTAWQNFYTQWQEQNITTKSILGFPNLIELQQNFTKNKTKGGTLLILDDLSPTMSKSDIESLHILLTITSHHSNVSIIFIGHNLFQKGMRDCSLQYHRYILTNNFRDSNQIALLGRQIFPTNTRFLPHVYKDILKTRYNNIILDLSPNKTECLRVTGGWFKSSPIVLYKQNRSS